MRKPRTTGNSRHRSASLPRAGLDQDLAGILEPVFAIRTGRGLGIGDTEGVRAMIDWCRRHGLNLFQTLPINETGADNSPYNAISALALEPSLIATDPRHIPDLSTKCFDELVTPELLESLHSGPVSYEKVKPLKRALLEAAFASFQTKHLGKDSDRARAFKAFQVRESAWLQNYSRFRALMETNGNNPAWDRWPEEHRNPGTALNWLAARDPQQRAQFAERECFFQYVQWIAYSQWEAVREYAGRRGVYLMGDIPFGVSRYSADTWANPEIFDLEWSGGAPPEKTFRVDLFTEKWGQNWGIPVYRWDELRKCNFDWWRLRVANVCKVFHIFRIDHVLGFFRVYSFPWAPERNAEFTHLNWHEAALRNGGRTPGFKPFADDTEERRAFNQAQGEELLKMVLDAAGENTVIAEDLGVVPDYVPVSLLRLGIPGFRIPMFFREHDGRYSDPKQYPLLSIAQPATHDHSPLAAMWDECWANIEVGKEVENSHRELQFIMDFAGLKNETPPRQLTDHVLEAFSRTLLQSRSWIVVFQITDVLGEPDRFNVPGSTASSNWSHRLRHTVRDLDEVESLRKRVRLFSELVRESGRTFSVRR